jgi:hypothetical protein
VSSSRDDGLVLMGARITNAVKCVPPENKPTPAEIATCNGFLRAELGGLPTAQSTGCRVGACWSIPITAAATTRTRGG